MTPTFHHAAAVDIIDPQVPSPAQPSPAQPSPAQPSTETALIDTKTRWIMLQRGGAGNPPIDPFGLPHHRSSTPEN